MIINPESPYKRTWDTLVFLITIYFAIEIPLRITFAIESNFAITVVYRTIQFLYFIDLCLNFFTGIRQGNGYITDKKLIAQTYLKSWFVFDFLAFFPFDIILGVSNLSFINITDSLRTLRLFQMTRIVRMARVGGIAERLSRIELLNPSIFRLIFFVFWILLIAHWIACAWTLLHPEWLLQKDQLFVYIRSLYWAITTIATIGYGDITPQNIPQTIFTIVVMMLGAGMYGYVIGNIANIIGSIDISKAQFTDKIMHVNAFIKFKNLSPELSQRLRTYYQNIWEQKNGYDEWEILKDLPGKLRIDIAMHLHKKLISKVPLFHDAPESVIRDIVLELRPIVFSPGEIILQHGDPPDCVYFLATGQVEIFSDPERKSSIAILNEGSFFGELALLQDSPRNAAVIALDFCECYILDKLVFQKILRHHPNFAKSVKKIARSRKSKNTNTQKKA